MPKATKSVGKSEAARPHPGVANLKPFQRGHDPRRGHGPEKGAPNAGRIPDEIKEMAREGYKQNLPRMIAIGSGAPVKQVVLNLAGEPVEAEVSVPVAVQIKANEQVGKVGEVRGLIGSKLEIEHKQDKPFVVVVRAE